MRNDRRRNPLLIQNHLIRPVHPQERDVAGIGGRRQPVAELLRSLRRLRRLQIKIQRTVIVQTCLVTLHRRYSHSIPIRRLRIGTRHFGCPQDRRSSATRTLPYSPAGFPDLCPAEKSGSCNSCSRLTLLWMAGLALMLGSLGSSLQAQDKDTKDITGNWQGTLQVGQGARTLIKISNDDGKLKAMMYNVDQGAAPAYHFDFIAGADCHLHDQANRGNVLRYIERRR